MDFRNVRSSSFYEVLDHYFKENGYKKDDWEVRNLRRAQEKFGRWIYAEIPREDVGEIVMPHYSVGGAEVIPFEGAFLKEAYKLFSKRRDFFRNENLQFVERLEAQKRVLLESGTMRAIYLSEEPLLVGGSYSGLGGFKGKLTHLDGLHRLFALMDSSNFYMDAVKSYIAVYLESEKFFGK